MTPDLAAPPLGDRDLMVDGEVIALNERGIPDFRVLQHRMHVRNAREVARLVTSVPATLMVFDLLRLDGEEGASWKRQPGLTLPSLGATG